MNSADSSDQITKDNRHQYFETAIASVSDADREIRQAEARGRQRRIEEEELKQTIKRVAWGVLALIICAVIALVAWKIQPH